MTVASDANRSGPYSGNGVTTVFDYEFRIVDENHVKVIRADADGTETILAIDADYIVSDVGNPAGGQVGLTAALAAGKTLTLLRNVPFTQETDLENQGAYYAETVEAALDLSVMRDQELQEKIDRAVLIPPSEDPAQLDGLVRGILRLADSADSIDVVADNISDVKNVSDHIADVVAAVGAATAAGSSATSAAESASAASGHTSASAGSAAAAATSATAAEAAKNIAQNFASDIVSQGNVPVYATAAGLAVLTIPAGITALRTNGYAAVDDGGGWFAVEVANAGPLKRWQQTSNLGTRRWELRTFRLHVAQLGFVGNGVTDNTDAAQALNAFVLTSAGPKIIDFEPKTYRMGRQQANTGGFAFFNEDMLNFNGVTGLTVNGNGATLKVNDGLKYGSFDPATGLAYSPPGNLFTNVAYAAIVGFLLLVQNSSYVRIDGFNLDGNQDNLNLGGYWGDAAGTPTRPGIQLRAVGFQASFVSQCKFSNIKSFENGLDGLLVVGNGVNEFNSPLDGIVYENCRSYRNGRQALSVGGGRGIIFENCEFSDTGQGRLGSSPRAGVDFEPNGVRWCSDITFINCLVVNNAAVGMITDGSRTKNIKVLGGEIWQGFAANGTTTLGSGDALWLNNGLYGSGFYLENVKIHGCTTNVSPDVVLFNCEQDNATHPDHGVSAANRTYVISGSGGIRKGGKIASDSKRRTSVSNGTFEKVTWHFSGALPDNDPVDLISNSIIDGARYTEAITAPPATGYYLNINSSNVELRGVIVVDGPNVKWASSVSTGSEPRTGLIPVTSNKIRSLLLRVGTGNNTVAQEITAGPAIPTAGARIVGDFHINTSITTPKLLGWKCTAAGTPGNWVPVYTADLRQQTLATDAAFTLTAPTSPERTLHTGTLTAARAVTLATAGATAGDTFRITRTGGGAFNLNVGVGPLKGLATNTWGEFVYDGAAWYLSAYGAL